MECYSYEQFVMYTLNNYSPWTYQHSLNVEVLAMKIGRYFHLKQNDLDTLAVAARLHDVGKMLIPHSILNKGGPLTVSEREIMNQHAEYGYNVLKNFRNCPAEVLAAAREHHIPYRFMEQPSLITEIVQAADCAEAMMAERPYKKARSAANVAVEFMCVAGSRYREEIAFAAANVLENGC